MIQVKSAWFYNKKYHFVISGSDYNSMLFREFLHQNQDNVFVEGYDIHSSFINPKTKIYICMDDFLLNDFSQLCHTD